ncbi:MAG: Signal peptide peptidase SppA, 36K type [Marinimicrobia bacterium 46_43]|nr:MAG: Signal peptide peptidase SppA, 36K type [Marinimicrobia bacterium 46_43]HBY17564.1 signal peptide peptidase SppA [Candidatus Neomarinimicrobiota bacterium]
MKRSDWIITVLLFVAAVLMFNTLIRNNRTGVSLNRGDQIGIVKIQGTILSSEPILEDLEEISSIRDLKALILHINSPGGGTAASQELYYAVKRIKEEYDYPVISVLSSLGASGGYYIALATDSIYALPGSLTGSIGVIMDFPQWTEVMDKIGVDMHVVKSGEYKDTGSPFRDFTVEDRRYYQGLVDDVYDQFISAVADARSMDKETVRKLSDGRVYTGRQALELGLIDHLGTVEDGIEDLTCQLNLKGKPSIIRPKKEKITFFDVVFGDISRWIGSLIPSPSPQMIYK